MLRLALESLRAAAESWPPTSFAPYLFLAPSQATERSARSANLLHTWCHNDSSRRKWSRSYSLKKRSRSP